LAIARARDGADASQRPPDARITGGYICIL